MRSLAYKLLQNIVIKKKGEVYVLISKRRIIMPFNDGNGPQGMGPLTGRGNGFCAGNQMSNPNNRNFGSRNRGYNNGGYRQRGFGGMYRSNDLRMSNSFADDLPTYPKVEQELEFLEEQKKVFKAQSEDIEKRINQLKKA
jgi:hypothetical protein